MNQEETSVLIVGGSMVGLAAAMFLARQGVGALLVERRTEISTHPRGQAASPRTMELMRACGLEGDIRAAETADAQYGDILQVESLAGRELGRFDGPFRHDTYGVADTGWTLIGQDRLEPVLRTHAIARGADIRFGTEMESFAQDDGGVTATVRDVRTGVRYTVRARYLVAADGNRGAIRAALGITTSGRGVLGRQLNILFHADLRRYVGDRRFFLCFVNNPEVHGVLGQLGAGGDRWVLAPSLDTDDDHSRYDEQRCVELVRAAVGHPAVEPRIETVTSWEIAAELAHRFRAGRILLAGDAAHLMPPTGGFGGNLGLQDAHNLAWKLAMVVRGTAGTALLDSYEEERLPIAEFTVDQAVIRYLQRSGLDENAARRHRREEVVLFGHCYRSGAVAMETDAGAEVDTTAEVVEDPVHPSGRPGTRAPHLTLLRDGVRLGVHELLEGGFVLLTGARGGAWKAAAIEVHAFSGPAIEMHVIGGRGLVDEDGGFSRRYGVQPDGAVLVRPDGFIAWRCTVMPEKPAGALASALSQMLGIGASVG